LDTSVQAMVDTGLWPLSGVAPKVTEYDKYADSGDNHFGAAPFEKLQERLLHVHDGCISPNNMGFCLNMDAGLCSFFSATVVGPHRAIAFHILPCREENEDQLRKVATDAVDALCLSRLLPEALNRLGSEDAGMMVRTMLQALVEAADARLAGEATAKRLVADYAKSTVREGAQLPAWPVLAPSLACGRLPPPVTKAPPVKPPEPEPSFEESDGDGAGAAAMSILVDFGV